MKTLSTLLALAIVALFAVGCASKTTTQTTGMSTTSTVGYSK